MSTTTPLPTLPQPAADYHAAVTAALAGLPDGEREELLEEVAGHLADVAGELGPDLDAMSLRNRLGTPEAYAAELRTAAGYDAAEPLARGGVLRRMTAAARARAASRWSAIEGVPGAAGVRRLVVELRPGWWVVRVWVLLTWVSLDSGIAVVPNVTRNALFNVTLLAAAIFCSVWLGRRVTAPHPSRGWRRAVIVANVVLVAGSLQVYDAIQSRSSNWNSVSVYPEAASSAAFGGGAASATNLFAFTPDGKLIPEFYLYDENGQPVDIGDNSGCAAAPSASALPFDNHYPREQYTERTDAIGDVTADCVPTGRAPGFSVAIPSNPSASASASTVPSPAARTSASSSSQRTATPVPTASP